MENLKSCLIKSIMILSLLIIFHGCYPSQGIECTYDDSFIDDNFLKVIPNIHSYNWDESDKEGQVILNSGEFLYIKKWACVHIGLEADVIVFQEWDEVKSIGYWKEKVLFYGSFFLNENEMSEFTKAINIEFKELDDEFKVNDILEISCRIENYPEFFVSIERNRKMVLIDYYYYHL